MKYKFKKSINIVSVLFLILLLSSCFGSNNDEVNKAKQDLWITESSGSMEDTWSNIDTKSESGSLVENQETKQVEITPLTSEQFVELDDLSNEDFSDWEVEIKWKTLTNVDKIIITFENKDSQFPIDKYDLKQFKPGDKEFTYRAFSKYESLDYGKNVYTIEAHSWDKVSKLQLVINLKLKEDRSSAENVGEVSEDISLDTLPTSAKFWNPIQLWSWKVWYSDIKWLEIRKDNLSDLTCEKLTESLSSKIDWYFFWNTCRPINTDKWFSFFIIRLAWDKYYYEKHYYLSSKWIYWVQELETWTWVTKEIMEAKNLELKAKNASYDILKISDSLFNELVK